ncbi:MAG: DUF302 domain-containing protein [Epsilonproteobacteria bacterium]|nr:DUF302 domain-containing protein [Campylobacterota bacterium]
MKKIAILISIFALIGCAEKTKNATSKFIKLYESKYDINQTIDIIKSNLSKKNYSLVNIYSHEPNALKLKEMLYPTLTLNFNNPKISTKLLQCNPTLSLELPIRIGVYNNIKGKTFVTFTDSEYWSIKHNVKDAKCLSLLILIKKDLLEMSKEIENDTK